jgi:hypothetical protein
MTLNGADDRGDREREEDIENCSTDAHLCSLPTQSFSSTTVPAAASLSSQRGQRLRPAGHVGGAGNRRVRRSEEVTERNLERSQARAIDIRRRLFASKVANYEVAFILIDDICAPVYMPLREWRPRNKDAMVFARLDMNRNEEDFTNRQWTTNEDHLLPEHAHGPTATAAVMEKSGNMIESFVGTLRWIAEEGKGRASRMSWAVKSANTGTTITIRRCDLEAFQAPALGELGDLLIANRIKVARPTCLVPVRHRDAELDSGNHLGRYFSTSETTEEYFLGGSGEVMTLVL